MNVLFVRLFLLLVRLFLGGKIETCSMGGTTFRLSQSSCRPEGDQKRSDPGENPSDIFGVVLRLFNNQKIFGRNTNFLYSYVMFTRKVEV